MGGFVVAQDVGEGWVPGVCTPLLCRAEDVLDATPEATVIASDGRVLYANREFSRMFGYELADCVGLELDELVVPDGRMHETELLLHAVAVDGRTVIETVRRTHAGKLLDVCVLVSRLELEGGREGLLVTYRDISRQKQEEARLRFTALHDGLTGLANRALFLNRVQLTLGRLRRRPDRLFAVIFLDLDGFKLVNDTFGHACGDALLLRVAQRLTRCVRPQDTVARLGGDEFALLIDESVDRAEVEEVAERLQLEICRTIQLEAGQQPVQARVSASLGLVLAHAGYGHAEQMLEHADRAMYAAKAAGKGRHVFFASLAVAA